LFLTIDQYLQIVHCRLKIILQKQKYFLLFDFFKFICLADRLLIIYKKPAGAILTHAGLLYYQEILVEYIRFPSTIGKRHRL